MTFYARTKGWYRFAMAVGVFALAGCATVYNPATQKKEFIFISTAAEVDMGQDIHQKLAQQYSIVESGSRWERVQAIGQKLAAVSDRDDYQHHFYLVDKDEMNAFTIPGGNVYCFTGLLDKLTTDDQVAAVLAHEIAHGAARHSVKKFQAALGYNLIGSILLSQIGSEGARQLASLSSSAVTQIVFSSYSRKDEYEADKLGVKYMHLAGYDLDGMIKTLEILESETAGPDVPVIIRSHPYLNDRIVAVKKEIGRYQLP